MVEVNDIKKKINETEKLELTNGMVVDFKKSIDTETMETIINSEGKSNYQVLFDLLPTILTGWNVKENGEDVPITTEFCKTIFSFKDIKKIDNVLTDYILNKDDEKKNNEKGESINEEKSEVEKKETTKD